MKFFSCGDETEGVTERGSEVREVRGEVRDEMGRVGEGWKQGADKGCGGKLNGSRREEGQREGRDGKRLELETGRVQRFG